MLHFSQAVYPFWRNIKSSFIGNRHRSLIVDSFAAFSLQNTSFLSEIAYLTSHRIGALCLGLFDPGFIVMHILRGSRMNIDLEGFQRFSAF